MFSIDISHAPHLYSYAAAGLVILWALVMVHLELRRVGSTPWPEWHNSRNVAVYRARRPAASVPALRAVSLGMTAVPSAEHTVPGRTHRPGPQRHPRAEPPEGGADRAPNDTRPNGSRSAAVAPSRASAKRRPLATMSELVAVTQRNLAALWQTTCGVCSAGRLSNDNRRRLGAAGATAMTAASRLGRLRVWRIRVR